MTVRVLVADDDRAIRESLERALELEGYEVTSVADGVAGPPAARRMEPDIVVLDVMMPSVDGLGVCRVLRADGVRTPILMLTARVELDRSGGRVGRRRRRLPGQAVRVGRITGPAPGVAAAQPGPTPTGARRTERDRAGVRVDPGSRRAWWRATELELSKTEFDLLELLVRNAGLVLTHSAIYDRIWGYDFGPESKNLAVYISYLRRKLDAAGAPSTLIRTVRGVGYSVAAE